MTFPRTLSCLLLVAGYLPAGWAGEWAPLAEDGLHDPSNPDLTQKQEPRAALAALPPDAQGNQVRWVHALDSGAISPRSAIQPGASKQVLELDTLLNLYGSMPIVRFSHKVHTLWLDCANCHEQLFKSEAGANKFSMEKILQREQCGVCHGAVSFPLTECQYCHSIKRHASGAPMLEASP